MNWSKAKTILIVAFIITDVFLILTYGKFSFASGGFKSYEALPEYLAQKEIYVDSTQIPQKHRDMPVLFVHKEDLAADLRTINNLIASGELHYEVRDGKDEEYRLAADTFLKDAMTSDICREIMRAAAFGGIERDNVYATVTYKNTINSMTIEKSHITCTFSNGVLGRIDCEWLRAVNLHNKKQKTISAAQALLLFVAHMRDEGNGGATTGSRGGENRIYIDSIEMVYWLDEGSIDVAAPVSADTALPAWKIAFSSVGGDEVVYIDAYERQ